MFRGRRGTSYIVEASLVYPMITAVTVMLLAAAVYIYGLTAACSDLNRMVRRSAGMQSCTVFYNEVDGIDRGRISVIQSGGILSEKVSAAYNSSYINNIIFRIVHDNEYRAEAYVICEAEMLWNQQAAENAAEKIRG